MGSAARDGQRAGRGRQASRSVVLPTLPRRARVRPSYEGDGFVAAQLNFRRAFSPDHSGSSAGTWRVTVSHYAGTELLFSQQRCRPRASICVADSSCRRYPKLDLLIERVGDGLLQRHRPSLCPRRCKRCLRKLATHDGHVVVILQAIDQVHLSCTCVASHVGCPEQPCCPFRLPLDTDHPCKSREATCQPLPWPLGHARGPGPPGTVLLPSVVALAFGDVPEMIEDRGIPLGYRGFAVTPSSHGSRQPPVRTLPAGERFHPV